MKLKIIILAIFLTVIACGGSGDSNTTTNSSSSNAIESNLGKTCTFNTDCGVGLSCYKAEGKITGVCVEN